MRGKIITAVLAVSIFISGIPSAFATGQYYITNEYPTVNGGLPEYVPSDINQLDELTGKLDAAINTSGNEDKIIRIFDELYNLFVSLTDDHSLALLQSDKEFSENNRQTLLSAANNAIAAQKALYGVLEDIYNSEYTYLLNDMFGEENVKLIIESAPSERYYELTKQEEELVSKYESVYGDAKACAELFSELVEVRNELAKEAGYDSYAELANERIYYRDYSDDEIREFSECVREYYFPLLQSLLMIANTAEADKLPMSEEKVISSVEWLVENINYELTAAYRHMVENGLYDIAFSDKKSQSGGAYTLYLNELKVPYIFMSPSESCETNAVEHIKTLIHEFGHYAALLNDPVNYEEGYILNNYMVIDTAEVHSQGLEMLSMPYYGRLFGRNAAEERLMQLTFTVSAVVDGMMMHEFQTRVYESENTSTEAINAIAAEVISKYYGVACSPDDAQQLWTIVPHTFNAPMYYLAYSVSGAASLAILAEAEMDYETALDKYMQLSASGVRTGFNEAMELCGFDSIFSVEAAREITYTISNMVGLLYEDISTDAWYAEYLYDVSDIFDGRGEAVFEPDANVTRGEFVEAIGKMYEYYVGDDMNYTMSFIDVDVSSEQSKYIAWASENGIVDGYTDTEFGPDDEMTREQLVAVMYRLAFSGEEEHNFSSSLSERFSDSNEIADWATKAMVWAVDTEIINGRENNLLVPQGKTTRAEAAKIISCYIDNLY